MWVVALTVYDHVGVSVLKGAAYFGQSVPDQFVEQFLLAGRDGLFAAGAGDVLGADVLPSGVAGHGDGSPSSVARSFR